MNIRKIFFSTCVAAVSATAALWAAHPATFLLKNGDRVSGELTYKGTNSATLNGRDYAFDDIAVIAFDAADPSAAELRQVPDVDNNPSEFQRHSFAMRSGQVIQGKLYHISPDGETITYDQSQNTAYRHTISANDLARVYINPASARRLWAGILNGALAAPAAVATSGVAATGAGLLVPANTAWTDTGIDVRAGSTVSFRPSGQIQIAMGTGPELTAGPDGSGAYGGPRTGLPVAAMPVGGLIAKVGNGAPFPIGSNTQPIRMPANGRLFLGINDDNFGDNTGSFAVQIVR